MRTMFSRLLTFLSPPVFDDEENTRIAKFLHFIILTVFTIAMLTALTDSLAGVLTTAYVLGAGISPLGIAYWLLRRGHVTVASYIVVVSMIAAITVLLSVGQGIHDIGLMDYVLLLIVSSYVLRQRGIVVVTGLIILSVALVVFGEIFHFLPVKVSPGYFLPRPADFFIVSLTIVIGAIAISMMANTLASALEKTRHSESRWRSLVDHAPDIIIDVDAKGEILFVNRPSLDLPKLYTGKSIFDSLLPENRDLARQILARVLGGADTTLELQAYNSQGELRWYSFRVGPIRQRDGRISGAVIIATNIQNQKNAEIELKASKEALQLRAEQLAMLYEMGKSVASLQTLDKLLEVILAQMRTVLPLDVFVVSLHDETSGMLSFPLIYEDGKLWNEPPSLLMPDCQTDIVIRTGKPLLTNHASDEYDNWEQIGDKEKNAESIMITPLLVGQRVIGAISAQNYRPGMYNGDMLALLSGAANQIGVAIENARLFEQLQKELAERKRVEVEIRDLNASLEERVRARTEELENTSKELSAFTYTVSHDLRAPLRAINGFSHIALDDYGAKLPGPVQENLVRIQENARQLGRLIDDLLAFTRIGRHPLRKMRVNLTDVAQHAFDEVTRDQDLRRIEFTLYPLPVVLADPMLLEQVFYNLFSNAIKF
ncbi:MAG: PAS domain S-box protein, partial [Chloroflexi bacterium]